MGSCDILLTRIFVNKIIIKSARETFMKKILLSFGCCLILAAVLVIAKISVTYYFTQLKNSDTLSYVLYFIFAVGSILIIRHRFWYIFVFLSREEFKISGRNYVYTNLYDDVYINLLDDEAYQICNKVI